MSKPDLSAAAALLKDLGSKAANVQEESKPAAAKAPRPADPKAPKAGSRPARATGAAFTRGSNRGK